MRIAKGCFILFIFSVLLWGRAFTVLEFRDLQSDFKAQTDPELDMDMNYCSVLRVESTRSVEMSLKEKTYRKEKISSGKYYFYFSSREKSLTLQSPNYEDLIIEAPERGFKPGVVYFLRVDTKDDVEVTINVNPSHALVRVNGKRWLNTTEKLVPGKYDLEITSDGYEPVRESFRIENRPVTMNYSLSKKAVESPVTTQPETTSFASASLPVTEAYDFSFQILSCKRMPDNKVVFKIRVTNLSPDDRALTISRATRFFDDQGREFGSPVRTIGNKEATYQNHLNHRMISDVPTLLTLIFSDVPRSSQSVSLLELVTKDWTLPFRSIGIE
jgi:hypothetical protein